MYEITFQDWVNRVKELGLKETCRRLRIRIRIGNDNFASRYVWDYINSYIITIHKDNKDPITTIWHELGHIILCHQISNLKEECEADNFALAMGGNIKSLINILNVRDDDYYGKYIREPIFRKILLFTKLQLQIKEKQNEILREFQERKNRS